MAWVWLVAAGIMEMFFAVFLKLSDGFSKLHYTALFIIAAAISFYFLTKAMEEIPIGTAYAAWTGIGSAGAVILGIILFNEPTDAARLFFVVMLIGSIIGLKFVSP